VKSSATPKPTLRRTFSSRFTSLHKLPLATLFLFMPYFLLVASGAGWLRRPVS
jgi:hypothetical protein